MLEIKRGNMFDKGHECYFCPVNTVGTMGNGLAKYFAERYPDVEAIYKQLCESQQLTTETPCLVTSNSGQKIILFATKKDWRNPSEKSYIETGLQYFIEESAFGEFHFVDEIALPALGCGKGGLDFHNDVRDLLIEYLDPWLGQATVYLTDAS